MVKRNNEYIYELVGKNIKKYRKEKNMTQNQLAINSNFSLSFIKNIEGKNSAKQMSLSSVYQISKTLDIDVYKLFIDEE